jgi:hypothetical protein
VPHISLVFREIWDTTSVNREVHSDEPEVRRKEQWNPTSREKRARLGHPPSLREADVGLQRRRLILSSTRPEAYRLNCMYGWLAEASGEQKRTLLAAFSGYMLDSMDVMLYALVLGQVQPPYCYRSPPAGNAGAHLGEPSRRRQASTSTLRFFRLHSCVLRR